MDILKNELVRVSHIFASDQPQVVINQVEEFKKGKEDFKETLSTTSVMVGQMPDGRPNFMVMTSCLCTWMDTVANYKSFQNKLALMNGQPMQ